MDAESSAAIEVPYTVQEIDSENRATIEEDHIEFFEQKRLGLSRFIIQIKDIIACDVIPGEKGDEIRVQRRIGNAMRLGPVDPESAKAVAALIERLRKK